MFLVFCLDNGSHLSYSNTFDYVRNYAALQGTHLRLRVRLYVKKVHTHVDVSEVVMICDEFKAVLKVKDVKLSIKCMRYVHAGSYN